MFIRRNYFLQKIKRIVTKVTSITNNYLLNVLTNKKRVKKMIKILEE